MTIRWSALIIGSLLSASFSPALAAAPDVVRDLAGRVGQIVGQASACPDIAQGRVQTIVEKFREAIRQASNNEGERDQLARTFNGYIAEGRSRSGAAQGCIGVERQLADLERSLGQAPAAAPRATAVAQATTGGAAATEFRGGVAQAEIKFGMVIPYNGPVKETARQLKLGIELAFSRANDTGGINGRTLKLVTADDGYDPSRTLDAMKTLHEKEQVLGFIGNVGSATAAVAIPYALERRLLFFAPYTGANVVRRDPPDRYVFNYRPSYAEETEALVRYLVKIRKLQPRQIVVFAQNDTFGDSGFAGVAKAFRALGANDSAIIRANYPRNTVEVDEAINQLKLSKAPIRAIIMLATTRAAAKFIEKGREAFPGAIFANISAVGGSALASELMLLGPRYTNGVIVTQGVPAVSGYSSIVLDYKNALAKYAPGEAPDYTSLEGYIGATILVQALKQTNPLDTEQLVDTLEAMRSLDLGLGAPVSFGRADHQASHKIWGTALDETGTYQPIELD